MSVTIVGETRQSGQDAEESACEQFRVGTRGSRHWHSGGHRSKRNYRDEDLNKIAKASTTAREITRTETAARKSTREKTTERKLCGRRPRQENLNPHGSQKNRCQGLGYQSKWMSSPGNSLVESKSQANHFSRRIRVSCKNKHYPPNNAKKITSSNTTLCSLQSRQLAEGPPHHSQSPILYSIFQLQGDKAKHDEEIFTAYDSHREPGQGNPGEWSLWSLWKTPQQLGARTATPVPHLLSPQTRGRHEWTSH